MEEPTNKTIPGQGFSSLTVLYQLPLISCAVASFKSAIAAARILKSYKWLLLGLLISSYPHILISWLDNHVTELLVLLQPFNPDQLELSSNLEELLAFSINIESAHLSYHLLALQLVSCLLRVKLVSCLLRVKNFCPQLLCYCYDLEGFCTNLFQRSVW